MTQHYVFNNKDDYYNTIASDVAGSLEKYTITSRIAKSGIPETTTLRSPQGNEGTIYWEDYEMEIDGVKHRMKDIRHIDLESGRGCRFPQRWILGDMRWRSGYMPDSKSWKAWALYDSKPEVIAVEFEPYRSKIIGKTQAATLGVSVSDADSVFIILFLIFSQLADRPRFSIIDSMLRGFKVQGWNISSIQPP